MIVQQHHSIMLVFACLLLVAYPAAIAVVEGRIAASSGSDSNIEVGEVDMATTSFSTSSVGATLTKTNTTDDINGQQHGEEHGVNETKVPFYIRNDTSILDYLDPTIVNDPDILDEISHNLQEGNLVVIKDAFIKEFAEYVWQDMYSEEREWAPFVSIKKNGHNFFKHALEQRTDIMVQTRDVFRHEDSRKFLTKLSGRNCMSTDYFSALPSLYSRGDHSNLHTDRMRSRSVTFLWQLSKNWKAEWGGAFYWNKAYYENAYQHPSFNTLLLFSVTSQSVHGVTPVTRKAHKSSKRLTFGGWYSSELEKKSDGRLYDIHTDMIEEWYHTPEERSKLTVEECKAIIAINVDSDEYQDISEARREAILDLQESVLYEGFGPYEESTIYTLGSEQVDDEENEDNNKGTDGEDGDDDRFFRTEDDEESGGVRDVEDQHAMEL